jgi:hypothetical protein
MIKVSSISDRIAGSEKRASCSPRIRALNCAASTIRVYSVVEDDADRRRVSVIANPAGLRGERSIGSAPTAETTLNAQLGH